MIGQTISHYRILEKLGEGGMGIVYKAEDTNLHRTVALKLLSPAGAGLPAESARRFAQEAEAAARLQHPNIATIFEFSEFDDPETHISKAFIAMEYVEGTTLRAILQQGPIRLSRIISIMMQLANALQTAHGKKVVHRDLKPENIVLTPEGTAKVLDFGISRILGSQTEATGPITGSTSYMSPEQVRGDPVDQRSDLFSLGVILYELVTGQRPFKGDHEAAILYSVLNIDPPLPSTLRHDLPPPVEAIVMRLLKKDARERYQSAGDLVVDIQAAVLSEETQPAPWIRRRWPFYGVLVLLVCAVLLFYSPLEFGERATPRETQEIVVLPFVNVDRNSTNQSFCDGLMEILTSKLTDIQKFQRAVSVVPSVDVRKRNITSVAGAREAFDASLVVSGSFQKMGNLMRLTLTLSDAKQLRQIQSKVLEDSLGNVAAFQDGIVVALASMLDLQLKPATVRYLASDTTASRQASILYVRAKGLLSRRTGPADVDTARALFQQALREDSAFVDAYAGIAGTYEIQGDFARAESTYLLAVRRRPSEWRAYNSLGVFYYKRSRLEQAASAFQQVIALAPDNIRGFNNLGGIFVVMHRDTEAVALFERSLAIVPNYTAYNNLGFQYFYEGRFGEAASMYRQALAINDDDYRTWGSLGSALYWNLSQRSQATAVYKTAISLAEKASVAEPKNATILSHLADFHSILGEKDTALALIRQSLSLSPTDAGILERAGEVYEQLGMREEALKYARLALPHWYRYIIEHSPGLEELRKDPRYKAFINNQ